MQTATLQGSGRTNQDRLLLTHSSVGVLDGATSWLPQDAARDGGWFAGALADALAARLDEPIGIPDALSLSILELRDEFGLQPGIAPESTVSIVRFIEDRIEVYVLSDSPVVVYRRNGEIEVIRDDRLQHVGTEERSAYRRHLDLGHGYGDQLSDLIANVQRAERVSRNTTDGYWIAEADPEAAFHGVTTEYVRDEISALLLLTDGAAAAVDDYGQPMATWAEMRRVLDAHGPDALLASIHAMEASDPTARRWPRAKPHDDKTLCYVQMRGAS